MTQTYNPRTDGITQSILSGWMKCRQFSKLALDGWTPMRSSAALQFGEMAHGVLEHLYIEVRDGRRTAPDQDEVFRHIRNQVDLWETSTKGARAGADAVQQLEQNVTLLEAVLPAYFKFWEKEDFTQIKWVALEEEFNLELFGVRIRGKIDGLYRDNTKALQLFETKTKGKIDEDAMVDLLAFDFQTDFYAIASFLIYGEWPKGARYNIIRRPGEKLGKTESLEQFYGRIRERVEKEPKYYFIRYRIDKPKRDLETFKKELKSKIEEFVAWREGKLPTYKNETACMDRFGACRFLKICASQNYNGFFKQATLFPELGGQKETKSGK